jgi:hypothetical protein
MKPLLLLLFFLQSILSYSKDKTATIVFDQYGKLDVVKDWKWRINGVELSIANPSVKFPVHYPKLDTIIYTRNDSAKKELIISRFTPGAAYAIAFNGCCESFDIIGNTKSKYPKDHKFEFPDTLAPKIENGTVQFKAINYFDSTLLIGSFGDIYGGYTRGILLTNNTLSEKVIPFLLPYSDYVNYVTIGTADYISTDTLNEEWTKHHYIILVDGLPHSEFYHPQFVYIKEFVHFQCRFFNRENLIVTYDFKTGETILEIRE